MFKREDRYIVFKRSDFGLAGQFFDSKLLAQVEGLGETVAYFREQAGKEPLNCVVVESDWSEFEPTWDAIERRMEGKPTVEQELRNQLDKFRWDFEILRRAASGEDQVADNDTEGMAWIDRYIDVCPDHPVGKLADALHAAKDALDQLARLGNGKMLGNSEGNVIAQNALVTLSDMIKVPDPEEPLVCTCGDDSKMCQLHTF